jgi:hypothetical protein
LSLLSFLFREVILRRIRADEKTPDEHVPA